MILNSHGLLGPGLGKNSSAILPSGVTVYTPPGSPLHWWDLTDLAVLFEDEAGATAISADGEAIARVNNKGSSAEFLSSPVHADRPTYTTAVPAGLTGIDGVMHFDLDEQIKTDIEDHIATVEAVTVAMVFAAEDTEAQQHIFSWDDSAVRALVFNEDIFWYHDAESTNVESGFAADQWLANIIVADDEIGGTDGYTSLSATVAEGVHALLDDEIEVDALMSLGERSDVEGNQYNGYLAEVIIWDGVLTAPQIASYKTYVTDKYGIAWL